MNLLRRTLILWALVASFVMTNWPALAGPWDFDGQAELTKDKIQTFLKRSVAHFELCSFNGFNLVEWQRSKLFLSHTGAKFIHGGELSWARAYPDHSYWDNVKARLLDLHGTSGLEDVMVEGFIAEYIGLNADATLIP